MMRWILGVALALAVVLRGGAELPGPVEGGYRLPNGWKITPIGKHIPAKDTVLGLAISPDGKFVAALSGGFNQHAVLLIDTGRLLNSLTYAVVLGTVTKPHKFLTKRETGR